MKKPPDARFNHDQVQHQVDLARRGHARQQGQGGGLYPPGEFVRSAIALAFIVAVIGVVVLVALLR